MTKRQRRPSLKNWAWIDSDGDGINEAQGVEGVEDGKGGRIHPAGPIPSRSSNSARSSGQPGRSRHPINIQLTDFGTMSAEMPKAEFDFDVMRWTYNEPVILSLLFKCPGWQQLFCDEELDRSRSAADTEMDPAARIELIKQAQQYVLEQAIVIPFASDWYQTASHNSIHDLRYDATFGLTYDGAWISQ